MILARIVRHTIHRAARPTPSVAAFRAAFAEAEALAPRPPPPPLPVKRAPVIPLPPPKLREPEVETSADWDPEPVSATALVAPSRRTSRDEGLLLQTIQGCKQLLIEIIRRAAYDWVLYRGHRRMVQRALADQAYRWLFLETAGTSDWTERVRDGKQATSFEVICESLDIDPERMRDRIRQLTPKNVTSVGRPAEYRRGALQQADGNVYSLPGGFVPPDDTDLDDNSGS